MMIRQLRATLGCLVLAVLVGSLAIPGTASAFSSGRESTSPFFQFRSSFDCRCLARVAVGERTAEAAPARTGSSPERTCQ